MAYDVYGIRFLLHAADLGVDFTDAATLGHLFLFADEVDLAQALYACRGENSPKLANNIYRDCEGYVDGVLRYMGAQKVESIDASEFEGATVVHDLNMPIPPELEEKYSVVVDGGTLEHVFDYPTALRNAMRMVRVGGHLILNAPVNNFPGHGFYQISPELFFRVLSPQFGFRVHDAVLMELYHPLHRWFRVRDPGVAGRRVMFRSHSRTVMYIVAERVGPVPSFTPPPAQGVYVAEWDRAKVSVTEPSGLGSTALAEPRPAALSSPPLQTQQRIGNQAKGLALRTLPPPVLRSLSDAKRTLPGRIQRSRTYRRLKLWAVWAVPRLGVHPHYSRARYGFEPVHEPWTASARHVRPTTVRHEEDVPPPMYGEP